MVQPVPTDKEAVDRVIAGGVSSPVRSPVYAWLNQNHARLAAQFSGVRVQWAVVAARLAELGIVDVNGSPPKAATVRRTWWRVRRDVAAIKRQAADKRAIPPPESVQAQPVAAQVPVAAVRPTPVFDPMEGADEAPATPRFGISTVRRD